MFMRIQIMYLLLRQMVDEVYSHHQSQPPLLALVTNAHHFNARLAIPARILFGKFLLKCVMK
jgi:hypothetical protein